MAIIRNASRNYSLMNNEFLRDENLSLKAKGLLGYLMTNQDGWEVYLEEVERHSKDGRDSHRTAWRELQEAGYITVVKKQNASGKFVYEKEIRDTRKPVTGKPSTGYPSTENPETDNPKLTNTNQTNTNKTITNKEDMPGKPDEARARSEQITQIVDFLNQTAGTKYRPGSQKTRDLITARLNEGFTTEDFKAVISKKTTEWQQSAKMAKFIRPETLFSNKFEGYLNEPVPKAAAKGYKSNIVGIDF
jgi:uncharacterized phage protein (TIGR02220 family)